MTAQNVASRLSRGSRRVRLAPTNRPPHADKRAPKPDPGRRTATNPHLPLTTSPCGRDVFGAVCETARIGVLRTIFGSSRTRRSPVSPRDVRRVRLATKHPRTCAVHARLTNRPTGRHRRTARASASVRVIARCLVGTSQTSVCRRGLVGTRPRVFGASCTRRKGASCRTLSLRARSLSSRSP